MYRKILQWLCRRELRKIADMPKQQSIQGLIQYYDMMAIECVGRKSAGSQRVMGMSVQTAKVLEGLDKALTPRSWSHEMDAAWHLNIPDTINAFNELKIAALQSTGIDVEKYKISSR